MQQYNAAKYERKRKTEISANSCSINTIINRNSIQHNYSDCYVFHLKLNKKIMFIQF